MAMAKMCVHSSSKYALPNWNFLCSCEKFHVLIFQVQTHISTIPILVRQYVFMCIKQVSSCTMHDICPFKEKKLCQLYEASSDLAVTAKLYKRKDIFMMDT